VNEGVVAAATAAVAQQLGKRKPRVAIVLGSGLGFLATEVADPLHIPYRSIPGFPEPGVAGHKGELVAGTLEGVPVIVQAGLELQGVVEEVSLRRTRLRSVTGEVIHIHNSQIQAVRVLPRGVKELAVELFVSKREAGEQLVADVSSILPEGPTTFVRRPWIEHVDELSVSLTRIRIRTTVAPGREWLVEGFFADLLKEQASDSLIVHGPVTLAVDERATWSFARASGATRGSFARARRSPVGVP